MKHHTLKYRNVLFICCVWVMGASCQKAETAMEVAQLVSQTVLTRTGYCSDGSDRARNGKARFPGAMEAKIISHKDYQYAAYYERDGGIIIARRKLGNTSLWEKSRIQGYTMKSQDRHNKLVLAISKGDGVIHVAFDHHNTPLLNYACSEVGVATSPDEVMWSDTIFSLQPNLGITAAIGLVTYPIFSSNDKTGDLILSWRTGGAIGGEMNLAHYDSQKHLWNLVGRISSRYGYYNGVYGTRGPYNAGYVSDTKGVLHVSWLWREDFKQRDAVNTIGNHGLFYAQSSDGGLVWKNTHGKIIAHNIKGQRMSIDSVGTVPIEIPMRLNPTNVGINSAIDTKTNDFYTVVTHLNEGTNTYSNYLYCRSYQGTWRRKVTPMNGEGILHFYDDYLFFFHPRYVFYAQRKDSYEYWKKIKFPIEFKKGQANWDLDRLSTGGISMVIQYDPKRRGEATPIEVFDFKILN